jgi:hypothetical protein
LVQADKSGESFFVIVGGS